MNSSFFLPPKHHHFAFAIASTSFSPPDHQSKSCHTSVVRSHRAVGEHMAAAPARVVSAAMPARAQRRSSAGHAPARLGRNDSWGVGVARGLAERAKSAALAQRNCAVDKIHEPTEPMIGAELRVWWSAEGQWFDGVVDGKQIEQRRWLHHITYTDGDDRWHHLPSMDWTAQLATNLNRAKSSAKLNSSRPSHVAPAFPRSHAPKCRRRRLVREARRRARRAHGNTKQAKDEYESLQDDATSLLALRSPPMAAATEEPRRVERSRLALVSREFVQSDNPSMLPVAHRLVQQVVRFERTGIEAFVEAYDQVDGLHTLSVSGRSWREALVGKSAVAFTRVSSSRAQLPSPPILGLHGTRELKQQCLRGHRCSRDAGKREGFCNKCQVCAKMTAPPAASSAAVDMVACMSLLLLRSVF